ncbi:myo-inositol-1-phosphate synthase [Streptomyces sp. MA5143a]|uniref:myo-inositol-1-phosphate synthase n=1 Tax=Streptomyces sp. MA5143a TaxID=2083010 RepID=UPI000D1B8200|nr:myo-inositol-1-phosphate synthase [Streptomyces sp. MA5143a]SPF06742.1 Inositol-3-phosphate synthase [Streptomyces sp. MA5143a]
MKAIRVALAGTGNCAWSFSQFVAQAQADPEVSLPGLMCRTVGGYRLADVRVVAAFDVDADKVGRPLAAAFEAPTVSATRFTDLGADRDAPVLAAPLLDGLAGPLGEVITPAGAARDATSESVAKALVEHDVDVLVITLPTGAAQAVRMFAEAALTAGAAVVNCTPEVVARDTGLSARFADAGVPLLGDDLRSHVGATTLHTALIELLLGRGLELDSTYQLNVGGNTDFLNLADATRSATKFTSKANALRAAGMTDVSGVAGPTGFIGHLADTKLCFANVRATSVLGSEVQIDVKLTVEDSPNAAGVIANAVRAAKTAADRNLSGAVHGPAPMLFKSPPNGLPESQARAAFLDFAS